MSHNFPIANKKQILSALSSREQEILLAILEGGSRRSIAEKFSISVLTYDEHRKNIRNKLGIRNNADWILILSRLLPENLKYQSNTN